MNRRDAIKQSALFLGYAVSATTVAGIMSGCKAEPKLNWKPAFLSEDQAQLVGQIADIIIPTTDTPGALDVGVDVFIDEVINNCYDKEAKDKFLASLNSFVNACQTANGSSFSDLSEEQKVAFLNSQAEAAKDHKGDDKPFFSRMRELTLSGYFTSEKVGTEILAYAPVPGPYQGCIPLEENGGLNWSL